ncbi:MAG TPA: ElyC/SanA/YdcF family protein [Anaerovoracaceae bacterium]|nr:ElyC/SanA/YdcF family protein [Anaerovoracaceae bacterium]
MKAKIKHFFFKLVLILILAGLVVAAGVAIINGHVVKSQEDNILWSVGANDYNILASDAKKLNDFGADCILVLGAGLNSDGTPSPMLKDRLDAGIRLYKEGFAPKILLSGDNGSEGHNEIHSMLTYTLKQGIPPEVIFCDHAGFSTFDSMVRCQEIFKVKRVLVVTQTYHEYRALYIGDKEGLTVAGVSADQDVYRGQFLRDAREILARVKDFFKVLIGSDATLGGESIPISGSGLASHGE